MNTSKQQIISAHNQSSQHREQLLQQQRCGCFYCLEIFDYTEIEDWTDEGTTALCPYCGIDAVIPETQEQKLTKEYLSAMHDYWF